MGGDNAPLEIVRGALAAHKNQGVEILLVGRTAEILRAVEACGEKTLPAGVEVKDAAEVVEIFPDRSSPKNFSGVIELQPSRNSVPSMAKCSGRTVIECSR